MPIHSFRKHCRLCGSGSPLKVVPLKPVPVGEHYYDNKTAIVDKRYPIDLYKCEVCGAVQTQDDISSSVLWEGYTYFSGQTKGILKHFQNFVDSCKQRYDLNPSVRVFDVGSNDGSLLKCFQAEGCLVYGIDPSDVVAHVAQQAGIDTFVGFFSDETIPQFPEDRQHADIITAFNVFAHSPDMPGMIRGVQQMLSPDGIFCFEVQYLGDIVTKKLLGSIFHEHMVHYSLASAKNFLESYGMKLLDFERNNIQMGSIIFYSSHKNSHHQPSLEVDKLLRQEEQAGLIKDDWRQEFSQYINRQHQQIQAYRQQWAAHNFSVAGYGAARSGPTLAIQFGLENCLQYVLDDHTSKCGKYGVFEAIEVRPTRNLYSEKPDVVVILAWIHTKSIVKNNIKYLELGGRFITLWPEVAEVTISNVDDWYSVFDQVKNFGQAI
jgi:hypothetical protein